MIMSRQRIIEQSKKKNISYLRDPKMTEYISDGVIVALRPVLCEDVARIIWKKNMEYNAIQYKKKKFKDIPDEFISALHDHHRRIKYWARPYICLCKKACICRFSERLKSFYMKDVPPDLHYQIPTRYFQFQYQ